MKSLFYSVIVLLLSIAHAHASNYQELFDNANKLYAEEKYDEAIKIYEQIATDGYIAPELFFNTGNAYFKKNKIAYAILNYEKAKKLQPADDDILQNLKMANSKITDKISNTPVLFINEWKDSFFTSYTEMQWSVICIVLLFITTLFIVLYITSHKTALKQIGFWSAVVFSICSISVFFIAKNCHTSANENREGVILSTSTTVKGSPNENGTKLFILHEGTKVNIESFEGEWTEIRLSNGNVGWVKASSLAII